MIARFAARCQICQEDIHEGDSVSLVENEWCHDSCAEEFEEDEAAFG